MALITCGCCKQPIQEDKMITLEIRHSTMSSDNVLLPSLDVNFCSQDCFVAWIKEHYDL